MALQSVGLPSLSAATTDLWPSVANTLALPFRGPNPVAFRVRRQEPKTATPASIPATAKAHRQSTRPELPDFVRDSNLSLLKPSFASSSLAASSSSIHTTMSSVPRFVLSAANPLSWRPFLRPLPNVSRYALPAFRGAFVAQSYATMGSQRRGFGTNGISRNLLASREAAANRNPNSASAQNAFYQLLLKANMPAIVVERYQSNRYASNPAADEAYARALGMLSPTAGTGSEFSSLAGGPVVESTGGTLTPAQRQAVDQAIAARASAAAAAGRRPLDQDGPLNVLIVEPLSSIFFRWFKFLASFAAIVYLSLIAMSMLAEGMNIFKRPGARTTDSEVRAEKQTTRFSDVHGCDEAKDELQELVDFLKNPEKFSNLGGKLPKGVLLVGPPGTGKTLLARAVAGEAGVPFFYMSGSEFDEIYVGVGAKRVRDLFAAAKSKSPAIVFIDELDAIGGKRNARDAAYVKQTLNQLLTELDGFEQNSGVIIIAATNFPQLLDTALTRPGRFDRHVEVPLPDVRGRIAILKHHAKKVKAAPDVNLDAIAARTVGLSGAELENIVNQAAVRASRLKATSVTKSHFDWAMDKVILGAEKKTMVISEKEVEMTAYHEAGHALVMYFKENGPKQLYKVTVLPRGPTLGHTAFLPEMDKYSSTMTDLLSRIEVAMGGKAAEEIVYGQDKVTTGVSADIEGATRSAFAMVTKFGMSPIAGPMEYGKRYSMLSSETKAQVESEVRRLLTEGYDNARSLLITRRKELDLLAKALVEYETLDREEVEKVIRGEDLPDRQKMPRGPMKVPKPMGPEEPVPPVLQPPMGDSGTATPPTPPPPPPPQP